MTSRKKQQAARQYMREHDVPYMEALRRVTSSTTTASASSAPAVPNLFPGNVRFRDPDEPLVLGYTTRVHEPPKRSLWDRLSRRPAGEGEVSVEPWMIEPAKGQTLPFVAVYGPPGSGKTTLIRSIIEQYRGYAAYVVGGSELVRNSSPDMEGMAPSDLEGVEPWDGLVHVNLRPVLYDKISDEKTLEGLRPPSSLAVLKETLVVLDLGGFEYLDSPEFRLTPEGAALIDEWRVFEDALKRMARAYRITVAKTVMTSTAEDDYKTPLSKLPYPLSTPGVKVRTEAGYSPGGRAVGGVYEALTDRQGTPSTVDHFTLTEAEVTQGRFTPKPYEDESTVNS